jgi:hypothetical protein
MQSDQLRELGRRVASPLYGGCAAKVSNSVSDRSRRLRRRLSCLTGRFAGGRGAAPATEEERDANADY